MNRSPISCGLALFGLLGIFACGRNTPPPEPSPREAVLEELERLRQDSIQVARRAEEARRRAEEARRRAEEERQRLVQEADRRVGEAEHRAELAQSRAEEAERRAEEAERRAEAEPSVEVVPPEPSTGSLDVVDEFLSRMDTANAVFNAPDSMQYQHTRIIELVLSPSVTVADLRRELSDRADIDTATVLVSNRMKAELKGSGFRIDPLQPELQAVSSRQPTRWRWEVTPLEDGRKRLHVSLTAPIRIEGSDTSVEIKTLDRQIEVHVSTSQRVERFVSNNWEWLWSVLVAPPIALLVWGPLKKRVGTG